MHRVGAIKNKPASAKDYFFDDRAPRQRQLSMAERSLRGLRRGAPAPTSPAPRIAGAAAPAAAAGRRRDRSNTARRQRVVRATHRVSFDVHEADRFVLLGPSGCGKSHAAEGGRRLHRAASKARSASTAQPVARARARTASSCSRNSTSCRRGRRCWQNVMFPLLRLAPRCAGARPSERALHCAGQGRAGRRSPTPTRTSCPAA